MNLIDFIRQYNIYLCVPKNKKIERIALLIFFCFIYILFNN
jgi:hypothetical protein